MCGIIHLGDKQIEIECQVFDPCWWRHPDPVIDLTRIKLDTDSVGPKPESWRAELTKIGGMLATAGRFRDAQQANRLGNIIAEVGNCIAEQAEISVRFEWTTRESTS